MLGARNGLIESHSEAAIWLKLFVPMMLLAGGLGIFGKYVFTWRIVFILPFLLAAWFLVTLAIVQVRGGTLRYRRLFTWTNLEFPEVLASGQRWGLGYVRLKRFVFPWGRLYFVLDRNLNSNPFQPGDYALLRHLRRERVLVEDATPSSRSDDDRMRRVKLVSVGAVGAVVSLLGHIFMPRPGPQSVLDPPFEPSKPAAWFTQPFEAYHFLSTFPIIQILFAILILLAISRRRRSEAWILAFAAGSALGSMVSGWMIN